MSCQTILVMTEDHKLGPSPFPRPRLGTAHKQTSLTCVLITAT